MKRLLVGALAVAVCIGLSAVASPDALAGTSGKTKVHSNCKKVEKNKDNGSKKDGKTEAKGKKNGENGKKDKKTNGPAGVPC